MSKLVFLPQNISIDVEANTKILAVAIRNKIPIRFGCAACQCGTCGVSLKVEGEVSEMKANEKLLLTQMQLPTDGTVRLACQTKVISGLVQVDLNFQTQYDPDDRIP